MFFSTHRTRKIDVTQETQALLQIGEQAIAFAKSCMPDGAGNITADIKKSRGASYLRSLLARKIAPPHDDDKLHTRETAYSAFATGGGNCDEYASIVAIWLRQNGPIGKYIAFCEEPSMDHVFVVIKNDDENHITENDIVVDAWPPQARALLAKHYKIPPDQMNILAIKRIDAKPFATPRVAEKYSYFKEPTDEQLQEIKEANLSEEYWPYLRYDIEHMQNSRIEYVHPA